MLSLTDGFQYRELTVAKHPIRYAISAPIAAVTAGIPMMSAAFYLYFPVLSMVVPSLPSYFFLTLAASTISGTTLGIVAYKKLSKDSYTRTISPQLYGLLQSQNLTDHLNVLSTPYEQQLALFDHLVHLSNELEDEATLEAATSQVRAICEAVQAASLASQAASLTGSEPLALALPQPNPKHVTTSKIVDYFTTLAQSYQTLAIVTK